MADTQHPAAQAVTTHYVEFRMSGGVNGSPHPRGQFHGAAAIIQAVHAMNAEHLRLGKPSLVPAFPDLVDGDRNPMGRVRVFGSQEALERLLQSRASVLLGLRQDEAGYVITASEVRPSPENRCQVAFIRDRSADREFVKHAERAATRAQRKAMERIARGEAVRKPPMGMVERLEALSARADANFGVPRAYLKLRSNSTGQPVMPVFVQAIPVREKDAPIGCLDSYGLSRRDAAVAVPHF